MCEIEVQRIYKLNTVRIQYKSVCTLLLELTNTVILILQYYLICYLNVMINNICFIYIINISHLYYNIISEVIFQIYAQCSHKNLPNVFQRKMKLRLLQLSKCYQVRFYCKNESLNFAVVSFYKFQNVTNPKNIVQNMKPRLSHIQVTLIQN